MDRETIPERSNKPFGDALVEAIRVSQALPLGRYSLRAFFKNIEGWGYDALRKMAKGELTVSPAVMEACAAALDMPAAYFREYRMWQIEQAMERNPEVVDAVYEIAMGFEEAKGELKGRRK